MRGSSYSSSYSAASPADIVHPKSTIHFPAGRRVRSIPVDPRLQDVGVGPAVRVRRQTEPSCAWSPATSERFRRPRASSGSTSSKPGAVAPPGAVRSCPTNLTLPAAAGYIGPAELAAFVVGLLVTESASATPRTQGREAEHGFSLTGSAYIRNPRDALDRGSPTQPDGTGRLGNGVRGRPAAVLACVDSASRCPTRSGPTMFCGHRESWPRKFRRGRERSGRDLTSLRAGPWAAGTGGQALPPPPTDASRHRSCRWTTGSGPPTPQPPSQEAYRRACRSDHPRGKERQGDCARVRLAGQPP